MLPTYRLANTHVPFSRKGSQTVNYASSLIHQKVNNLIKEDYLNNNHPLGTLSDAAHEMTEKKLLRELDCSRAYQCLQLAHQRCPEILAFNFASRTFTYRRRQAQDLNRFSSAFPIFLPDYLDTVIEADQCAQYVEDIGIAASSWKQKISNLRIVFKCIQNASLKLSTAKCRIGTKKVVFLG